MSQINAQCENRVKVSRHNPCATDGEFRDGSTSVTLPDPAPAAQVSIPTPLEHDAPEAVRPVLSNDKPRQVKNMTSSNRRRNCTRSRVQTALRRAGCVLLVAMAFSGIAVAQLFDFAHSPRAVSFQIESPTAAANIRSPVAIKVALHGATLGQPEDGFDHLHISVDGGEAIPVYAAPIPPLHLAPGRHTLAMEVAGPDHRPLTRTKTVTFTVTP